MKKIAILAKNKKGVTLIELIVTMVLSMMVLTSLASILPTVLRLFSESNEIAERNTLMNTVANHIVSDVSTATQPLDLSGSGGIDEISIRTSSGWVTYVIGNGTNGGENGVLYRLFHAGSPGGTTVAEGNQVLSTDFYKRKTVSFTCTLDPAKATGQTAYLLTVTVTSRNGNGISRGYAVTPMVLNQFAGR